MPGGTRLVALIALAITACLFAWRANTLLSDGAPSAEAQTFEQRQLTNLLEPVFGARNVRVATHTGSDGNQQFLLLVNSTERGVPVDRTVFDRVVTILETTAGYDRAADSLHIQPFAFAPGTAGGLQQVEMYELGALGAVALLILIYMLLPLRSRDEVTDPFPRAEAPLELKSASQMMRSPAEPAQAANEDEFIDVREAAMRDPKAIAQVVRGWLSSDEGEK
ncbi:hypothetical protein [Henriciella marina]|uniref:Flagellar M-ring C-terminal domain-containing protein n=1 Tax=Henriciella marina TaxID=453851 RepID=A0ABT4LY50_9PROT|nr:hypothetical protein [Henriciella marina]MCZ4299306.1 hypothetical protein [Henriciella marina]